MPLAATIGTAYGISKTLGFDPIKFVGGLFGGGNKCPSDIGQKRSQLAQVIDSTLTHAEKGDLLTGMESNVSANGASMARFFYGGGDCVHKNVTPGDQRFLDRLPVVLKQKQQAQAQAGAQTIGSAISGIGFSGQTLLIIGVTIAMVWVLIDLVKQ